MDYYIRRYSTVNLEAGMILANAVVSESGASLLIAEKTKLTNLMIQKISSGGVVYADVLEPCNSSFAAEIAHEERIFALDHKRVFETTKKVFNSVRVSKVIPIDEIEELANDTLNKLVNFPRAIFNLQQIKRMDAYTYSHSVNVGVLCGMIAKWMGHQDVKGYVLAGLLHDVGKTQISSQILNKPEKLTFEEIQIMQQHSLIGWEIAKNGGQLSDLILDGILSHHERLDGSGYPFNRAGEEISLVARAVALADVFDAMTSNRTYRNAVTPFRVMQEIFAEMFDKLDPNLSLVFLQKLRDQLTGSVVLLQNGMRARVSYIDESDKFRPVLHSLDGNPLTQKDMGFSIAEIIN